MLDDSESGSQDHSHSFRDYCPYLTPEQDDFLEALLREQSIDVVRNLQQDCLLKARDYVFRAKVIGEWLIMMEEMEASREHWRQVAAKRRGNRS